MTSQFLSPSQNQVKAKYSYFRFISYIGYLHVYLMISVTLIILITKHFEFFTFILLVGGGGGEKLTSQFPPPLQNLFGAKNHIFVLIVMFGTYLMIDLISNRI